MRDPIGAVLDTVDELSMWGAWLSAFCILSILGLIVAEVLARNLFNYSLYFAWEFSAYLMGAAFLLGAAYALRAGAQIRVNVLLENVPRPVSRFFDLFGTACGVLIAAYLTYALGELTWLSYVRELPLAREERIAALDRAVPPVRGRPAIHPADHGPAGTAVARRAG